MKTLRRLGLPGLLVTAALLLASCGGFDGSQGEGTRGMDHGDSGDTQASEEAAPETTGEMSDMGETTGEMQGMGGMSTDTNEMSRQMVAPNGRYSDAAFADAMVPHHEGAIEMAEVALKNAEHEEIKSLARQIIDSQRAEIEELGRLRKGLDGPTMGEMSEGEMNRSMGMTDAQDLAGQRPFDRAFIDAMIPHHESAIAMAKAALEESRNPDIQRIAKAIVSAQEREISEMRRWRGEWYPQG